MRYHYWGNIEMMENKMESTMMENQMEKKIENEMETSHGGEVTSFGFQFRPPWATRPTNRACGHVASPP